MNSRIRIIIGILILIPSLFYRGIVVAQDFSADIVFQTEGAVSQGKVFVAKDKVRMELRKAITISRIGKNIVWVLMPAEKMYMELPLKPQDIVVFFL